MKPRTAAVVALAASGVLARPAAAAEWTVRPAANAFGAGRESYRYTVNAGARVEDGIAVVNRGAATQHVRLSGPAWVRFDQDELTVPPHQTVEVPFAVAPAAGTAPGDYAGRIAGVPARLRVGGPLKPSLALERVRVHYAGSGSATVTYTIHNTGNAILGTRQTVRVSGPFGRWSASTRAQSPSLLPGARWKASVPLHGVVPALRLSATVTLLPLLTDASGSVAPLAPTRASGHAWTLPWELLVVAVAAVLVFVWRRTASGSSAR